MTIRIEKNTFRLANTPAPTAGHRAFRGLGNALEKSIEAGGNTWEGMRP